MEHVVINGNGVSGITAARHKIIAELNKTIKNKANYEHVTIFADEMTYPGYITSIQRSGLSKREQNQVWQQGTFGDPLAVLRKAAINNKTDKLDGMSTSLVMGTVPRYGTSYNDICINEDHVKELTKSVVDILDEL